MLNLLRRKICPIGVDLGSSTLKLMQLTYEGGKLSLVAAAQVAVPHELSNQPASLQEWYITNIKQLLVAKPFRGRKVITCLPSRELLTQHLRMAKMDESQLLKALPWEAQGKIPFDVNRAMLRHVVAGEVYEGSESKLEVVLMAASRSVVQQHLNLIERTKVEIESINVEPCALVDCFSHLLEQDDGRKVAAMFIDLGHNATKIIVCQGCNLVFARTIGIGAQQVQQALSEKLGVNYEEALRLYHNLKGVKQVHNAASLKTSVDSGDSLSVSGDAAVASDNAVATIVAESEGDLETQAEAAVAPTLCNLGNEIRGCVRYHDLMFGAHPIEKVVFVGGQSTNTALCQALAKPLGLPAQLGDPLALVNSSTLVGQHSDLQEGERHSNWAVAFGLSLGGMSHKLKAHN